MPPQHQGLGLLEHAEAIGGDEGGGGVQPAVAPAEPFVMQEIDGAGPISVPWRLRPSCPKGHFLEKKTAAGSWFHAPKTCSICKCSLTAGTIRYSCKVCSYHLCEKCQKVRAEEKLNEEITITVFLAAAQGALPGTSTEEDTWQVAIPRGAKVAALKRRIYELYMVPPPLQQLRRDVDSARLVDDENVACDQGDVLHLQVTQADPLSMLIPMAGGMGGMLPMAGAPMALEGLSGMAEALSASFQQAAEMHQTMLESLEDEQYHLTVVLREPVETRCRLLICATACVSELVDMAKAELHLPDEHRYGLEFAGDRLLPGDPVHTLGLSDGDILFLFKD